jgi:hypothetical protein
VPGDHLVEHDAQAPHVGAGIDRRAAQLLGRHVTDGAGHRAGVGAEGGEGLVAARRPAREALLGQLRQPEVEHLHVAVAANHDVLRLQVAVGDARLVGRAESGGDLRDDVENLRQAGRRLPQVLPERLPVDELGGDEVRRLDVPDLVDGDDVGVVERRGGARLALEAAQVLAARRQLVEQELERDGAAQRHVLRQVDHAHPAAADEGAYFVATELGPCCKGHRLRGLGRGAGVPVRGN